MRELSKILVAGLVVIAACGDDNKGKPDAGGGDDGGGPDAAVPAGITEAKGAADGMDLSLKINFAKVTYLKPQIGTPANDPAGFTIQAEKDGPGLFIAVDPATLNPMPAVGDTVSFTITTLATTGMQKRATAITSFTRSNTGFDVSMLSTDITSAADVVTMLDKYDSRLVNVTGALGATGSSGSGFQRFDLATTGIPADTKFQLRAPTTLIDGIDIVTGCTAKATNVPMGRFNDQAQVGAFSAADVELSGCAAPAITTVAALSATSVRVTFTRHPSPTSVTADGSQFTFDNGLTASAAAVSGRSVTVTTSAQTGGTAYALTVATTVKDLQGTPLAAVGNGTFSGFTQQAVVRINEVNANISPNGCDLIELRVVADGSMAGFTLKERAGGADLNLVFPAGFSVQKNQFIVVHLNGGNGSAATPCNPNNSSNETTAVDQNPVANFPANFDSAFDFFSVDSGVVATNNVFTLFDVAGTIVDAVFIGDGTSAPAGATLTAGGLCGAANQWMPAQATYSADDFKAASVTNATTTGTTAAGNSLQRIDNTDDNDKADWIDNRVSTWGALNMGQTAF